MITSKFSQQNVFVLSRDHRTDSLVLTKVYFFNLPQEILGFYYSFSTFYNIMHLNFKAKVETLLIFMDIFQLVHPSLSVSASLQQNLIKIDSKRTKTTSERKPT